MPQIDDAELFGNAEDQRAYEDFCANQEAVEKFTLDKPALICRWRMSNKKVPMLNRHIRALSERLVQGEPLTHNMLSWAKQHVEWSLAEGDALPSFQVGSKKVRYAPRFFSLMINDVGSA